MKAEDALFNWLQIAVVFEARTNDLVAKDTYDFFTRILEEDHHIANISYVRDPFMYTISYQQNGEKKTKTFDLMLVDKLLGDIELEPKYND